MARPDHRHEAKEAVEDEQEQGDGREAADAGDDRLPKRVRAEGRGDVRALHLDELQRERTRLEDEREILGLAGRVEPFDEGVVARDPVREVVEVDLRPGADLAVEHDREVLEEVLAASRKLGLGTSALCERPRDLVELVAARIGELERDDRLAVLEVRARSLELQVLARHLRDRVLRVRGVELEDVIEGL